MSRASLAVAVALGALLAACAGGGSGTGEEASSWDSLSGSVERGVSGREPASGSIDGAGRSGDPAAGSVEAAPGAQQGGGAGALDCSGTYVCRSDEDDDVDTIKLEPSDAGCRVPGTSGGVVLAPDGSIRLGGVKIGTWSWSGNGLVVTTEDGSATCTKR